MVHAVGLERWAGRRILIVVGSLELGGAERRAVMIARHFAQLGASVAVWGFHHPNGQAARLCAQSGILTQSLDGVEWRGTASKIAALLRFARHVRAFEPDVLLPFTLVPNIFCAFASGYAGCPSIWNQCDEGIERFGWGFEALASHLSSRVVSNSIGGKTLLARRYGVRHVRIVENGIGLSPPQRPRDAWRESLGVADDVVVFCMTANLSRKKDHPTLLRAWAIANGRLAAQGVDAVLVLAGRPTDAAEEIATLVSALEIGPSVRCIGPVEDVAGLLGASDVFVLATHSEGLSNAVIEAAFVGLPVLGTDTPGVRDPLPSVSAQRLTPEGDVGGLADQMACLGGDHALRRTLGAHNKAAVFGKYNPSAMCRNYEALLTEVVIGKTREPGRTNGS